MLLDLLKEVSLNTIEYELGLDLIYANVVSISPFRVKLQSGIFVDESGFIILNKALDDVIVGSTILILSFKDNFYVLGGIKQ